MFQSETEVVIIGNGPAGISLSAFLSGWHPFYNEEEPHPDPFLHENFNECADTSLLEQDLSWYESEFQTRFMPPTSLRYEYRPQHAVPHIVLGDGPAGGSWNKYDDDMATVSLSDWMNLPGWSLADWMGGRPLLARLPAGVIREYFREYVKRLDLTKNFAQFTSVTNVTVGPRGACFRSTFTRPNFRSSAPTSTRRKYWRVRGHYADGQPFEITCKRVVLACGRSHHRRLEVEGEMNSMNVLYSIREMQQLLQQQDDLNKAHVDEQHVRNPVVIVGDGISAADAIMHCLANGVPVVHVFRRNEKQLKGTMLARLSSTVYPEYSKIFDLMVERTTDPLYHRAEACSIRAINSDFTVLLEHSKTGAVELLPYRCLCICVGLRTELSMLEEKHEFHATYQSEQDPSLYAIGSAIGDHFVRYLIGGAFHVAQKILADHRSEVEKSIEWFPYEAAFLRADNNDEVCTATNSEASLSTESINISEGQVDEVRRNPLACVLQLPHQLRCRFFPKKPKVHKPYVHSGRMFPIPKF
ncbi:hypothetical protein M3Y99_00872200 [Aphelenchoides fujianensis]|nr:hypothetical protein M3Y99_00872200 [Aphelenchoides fujianensis]